MSGEWFYFGCGDRAGHYLLRQNGNQAFRYGDDLYKRLGHFDGCLAPNPESELYVAAMNRLGGLNYSALSWWDRSVDKRPASNSIIFAPGLTISPDDMLTEGQQRFPWVFSRLPKPVTLAVTREGPR
jgi:hypothetical protein